MVWTNDTDDRDWFGDFGEDIAINVKKSEDPTSLEYKVWSLMQLFLIFKLRNHLFDPNLILT